MANWTKGFIAVITVAILAIAAKLFLVPPRPPAPDYGQVARRIAAFNAQLAEIARAQMGAMAGPGLTIQPTSTRIPIGALIDPGKSMLVDAQSCAVMPEPPGYDDRNAFPSFQTDSGVAAAAGFNAGVVEGLAEAGATLDQAQKVDIRFDQVQIVYLDDMSLRKLMATRPDCAAALADHPLSMIRGYVIGRRIFDASTTDTGEIKANATKIGSFSVGRPKGENRVVLTDDAPYGFLQLYTAVTAPSPGAARSLAAEPVATRAVAVGTPAPGRTFIQRDAADTSGNDAKLAALLRAAGIAVARKTQRIAHNRMPTVAQIRFINAQDEALARQALAIVAQTYPDARLVHLTNGKLFAPPGQLELWLPKV